MIVCIAEKPSVAKDIARIIGATASRDGYMEGNGYQVTWTFGHLCELKMPEDYTPRLYAHVEGVESDSPAHDSSTLRHPSEE